MQRALDTHDTVLRELLARYYGYEVTTEGDSFTMAFHDPVDAVRLSSPQPLCAGLQSFRLATPKHVSGHPTNMSVYPKNHAWLPQNHVWSP